MEPGGRGELELRCCSSRQKLWRHGLELRASDVHVAIWYIVDRILGLYWGYIGIMEKKMEATI